MSTKFPYGEGQLMAVQITEMGTLKCFCLGVITKVERGRFQVAHAQGQTWIRKQKDKNYDAYTDLALIPENFRRIVSAHPINFGPAL